MERSDVRILLVDDDEQGLESVRRILEVAKYQVVAVKDGEEALTRVRNEPGFDVILSDVRMPRMGGLDFLKAYSVLGQDTPVILMTAFGQVEEAVWAMKMGAVDFLTKPFKRQALLDAVESAVRRRRALPSSQAGVGVSTALSRSELGAALRLVGSSEGMARLRREISQVAPTAATVLIQGESGTGKERVAQLLHEGGPRSQKPFVAMNCAAVPEGLIESELFGHERGAFTGATSTKVGLFELAHGGTLFLDEIGDMPLLLQAKLLRVLQDGEVKRVGATSSRHVDVRVIAASHRDLRTRVREGLFREDLLFRLEVITLDVPPLRERLEDLPELVFHFLHHSAERHGRSITRVHPDVLQVMAAHSWPGNVRELANVVERAVVFAEGDCLEANHLPPHLLGEDDSAPRLPGGDAVIPIRVGSTLRDVEDLLIRKTLEATEGDKTLAAKILGINPRTVHRKVGPQSTGDSESTQQ